MVMMSPSAFTYSVISVLIVACLHTKSAFTDRVQRSSAHVQDPSDAFTFNDYDGTYQDYWDDYEDDYSTNFDDDEDYLDEESGSGSDDIHVPVHRTTSSHQSPVVTTTTVRTPGPSSGVADESKLLEEKQPHWTTLAFEEPVVLACIIGGIVLILLLVVVIMLFIVYRMRKKDEGSYVLVESRHLFADGYKSAKSSEFDV